MNLQVEYDGKNTTLDDICLKPMEPNNNECAVFSPLQYWQLNETNLDVCHRWGDDDPCDGPVEGGDADWHGQFLECTM